MTKRKPKPPSWAWAVRSPLGASKADAKQRLAAVDIAAERTKRRHNAALLKTLEGISAERALNEAEKRVEARVNWSDLPDHVGAKPLAHPVRERMDLVPWNGVLAVAETMTEGIKTHDEGAWRKLSQREHVSRAMRHLALFLVGDVAEPHLFHAACRALMALESDDYEKIPFREGEYDVEKD
jgi:hypothetical protein